MRALSYLLISALLLFSASLQSQSTYKIDETEYISGEYYSTTGKPMVKRSQANRTAFLKSLGFDEVPEGYEVDHIIPLHQGGSDAPSNMQLLTVEQHALKTARERGIAADNFYGKNYKSNSTQSSLPVFSTPSYSDGRVIHTGPRGGKYYINSNGKKTYVKSDKAKSVPSYNSSTPSIGNSGRIIHTGPRGGKYYINSNGNKTYVKPD